MIWLKIIWLILGFLGWLFTYHSIRKQWYNIFKYEYWKSKNNMPLITICVLFPFWIIGGLNTILYFMITIDKKNWSLYFNIKRYERKQLLKKYREEYPNNKMKCLSIFDNISCSSLIQRRK